MKGSTIISDIAEPVRQKAADSVQQSKENIFTDTEEPKHEHKTPFEDDITRDKSFPHIFISKLSHSKKGAHGNERKRGLVYDNYHCCHICKNMKSNFRKHILTHKQEMSYDTYAH